MTISIAARNADGAFGVAVTSSSPAVAARCLYLWPGVGACTSQNITDPRLGPAVLQLMREGHAADDAIAQVVRLPERTPTIAYRQLTAIGANGMGAAFSGEQTLGIHGHRVASDVVVAGNLLASVVVLDAATEAYSSATSEFLEERLLAAVTAAVRAGGEQGPVHSAGLLVSGGAEWPISDLRVDWSDDPAGELVALWELWKPQRDTYVQRAQDPANSPGYGVPGDE